jgi:hypothetical protein
MDRRINMRPRGKQFAFVSLAMGLLLPASALRVSAGDAGDLPRIGFEEPFDTADGWKVTGKTPLRSPLEAKDGTVKFWGHRVAFDNGAANLIKKYPEFNESNLFNEGTRLKKEYDTSIDFETYRYIVVKLDERANGVELTVCDAELPVPYTTGVCAYDLKQPDKSWLWKGGKKKLTIGLGLGGTGGWVTFDYIRFVKELTEEEKKGLIPAPIEYKKEKLEAHPYHRLEAMNARAGRTRRAECEGQLLTYTDTLSGGEIWKVTDQPGDQNYGIDVQAGRTAWTAEGRYLQIYGGRGGRNFWDAGGGKWRDILPTENYPHPAPKYGYGWESRTHPGVAYGYNTKWNRSSPKKPICDFVFFRFDRNSGKEEQLGVYTYEHDEKHPGWDRRAHTFGMGDKFVLSLAATFYCVILDPDNADPGKRIQPLELPVRPKGTVSLVDNDTALCCGNSYTYEAVKIDLATRTMRVWPTSYGGSHGGSPLWYYAGMVLKEKNITDRWRPGDGLKVIVNYKEPLSTDYGSSFDDRWWKVCGADHYSAAPGTEGRNQHMLIDHEDCATIMRLNGFNLSKNAWPTRPYSYASPDAGTKIAYCSDQLGDGDAHYVVARRPDPPRKILVKKKEDGKISLSWQTPEHSAETAGYVVYGAGKDNLFRPLHTELLKETKWSGAAPEGVTRLMVAAREWSGLEGFPSPVLRLETDNGPDAIHLDVWLGEKSRTARVVFGHGSFGTRSVRYWKATPSEDMPAVVTWRGLAIPTGKVSVFAHQGPDSQSCDWEWKRLESGFKIDNDSLAVEVQPGILLDKVVVTNDSDYTPKTFDDRFAAPPSVTNAQAAVAEDGLVTVTWDKPGSIELSHVEVHSGAAEKLACDNTTAVGAVTAPQEQKFLDWDLKPGSTACYTLVPVSVRGKRGAGVTVKAEIPKLAELACLAAGFEQAKPGAGLETVRRKKEDFHAPKPVKENEKPEPNTFVSIDFPIEAPVDGQYSVWARYCPGYTERRDVSVLLDGEQAGVWRVRAPYRDMDFASSGPPRIFSDRLILKLDKQPERETLALKKGGHVIRLLLDPAAPGGQVHAVRGIWLSNDPSFRPEGYNPRADFKKETDASSLD